MEQIIIYHPDGTAIPLISKKNVSVVSKATQKTALLSDDVISITVSSAVPLDLRIGDTARIYGKPYKLNQLPEPTKNGERRYSYELRLEGLQYDLIDVHYHLPENAYGETFYADLKGHLAVLVWNINRIYPNKWALGEFPEDTDYKNITNSEKNALQVLQELCSDYGVEFEITTDGKHHTLNVRKQVGITHAFTLRFGRGKGLYQLARKNVNNAGITNRLYVYGGTENLGSNYGHTKLCLPGTTRLSSFLEDKESIGIYGVKEGEKNYSDIKPQRVGTVTALGKDVITFVDETMFDLNAKDKDGKSTKYLIAGTNAKIKFESGQLAGYEFDLHTYDHATHTFVINKFTDDNGMVFPSEETAAFQIQKGDKYSIFDINLPDEYRTKAEKELAEEATKYLPTVSQPQVSYKLSLTEGFFTQLWGKDTATEVLHVGDFIKIEDEQIGVSKAVRIKQIDRNLLKRHSYDITLSDTVTKSTTVKVINNLQEINETIAINKLADPTKARRKWRATQELLSMVFDPEGDYYSEKIKPLSIDTQMLSVGAKSTQFTLLNVTFQPNYNGDANTLYVSPGRLAHYAIDPEGVKYWLLDGATFAELDANTAYYIYARCSTTEASGVITLSTTAKAVCSEVGYYNFLVGVLNSVVTDADGGRPGRLVSLTYGSTTVNGRFVRTGRIESNGGGKCYFDLDNDEIGGVIHFVGSDGTIKNVSDVDDKTNEVKDYINNTLPGILNGIQEQKDGKRKVFVSQPYPPYDIGDLWLTGDSTNGQLKRCATARATGSFVANDWVIATYYDNTQTTIDGGIVTAGTVQLANGNSQSIVAGITGGETEAANTSEERKVRIWAGASKENRFTAPFRVLQDGSFVASKGKITGEINANTGSIGGFNIAYGHIGAETESGSRGGGLSIYNDFINLANSDRRVSLSCDSVFPPSSALIGVGYFENKVSQPYNTNYGISVFVSGGLVNIALAAHGAVVSESYAVDYGIAKVTPSVNTCLVPGNLTKPTIFKIMAKFIYSNSGIGLPTRDTVCEELGISSSGTPFAVRIVIICDRSSTQTGYVTGRNTFVTGKNEAGQTTYPMNTNQYPYRLNNNGGNETGKWNMAKGDIREFMLVWDGSSEYYAYLLNIRE